MTFIALIAIALTALQLVRRRRALDNARFAAARDITPVAEDEALFEPDTMEQALDRLIEAR